MAGEVRYRWVNGWEATKEDWDRIEDILATRGWMSLNPNTSRIRIAEDDDGLVGFHVLQMVPHAGPLFVAPRARATGIADKLADDMLEFLTEVHARGWIVIAESEHAKKLCEARGMTLVEHPVYTAGGL